LGLQEQKARRRRRIAEHAGEGVERESAAHARRRHVARQQRIIGGMIDGVAQAREREHRHEHPERMNQRRDGEGQRPDDEAGDEQRARAHPVDQESRRRLQRGRDHVEGGQSEAELGIAYRIVGAHEQEQRRQQRDVIVAHEMHEAHRADELRLGRARDRQG
jgi:hypothetical protein